MNCPKCDSDRVRSCGEYVQNATSPHVGTIPCVGRQCRACGHIFRIYTLNEEQYNTLHKLVAHRYDLSSKLFPLRAALRETQRILDAL